jgi:hypothetical protein
VILLFACENREVKKKEVVKKEGYVFTEKLIKGDTGMRILSAFKKTNIAEDLCQHWELGSMEGVSSIELVMEGNTRIFPDLSLFKDSGVVENARNRIRIGRWRIIPLEGDPELELMFSSGQSKTYRIRRINSTSLHLATKGKKDWLFLKLSSDGKVHTNPLNDPFHPANNQWRIKPSKPETDSAIHSRVRQCVWFYMLYFRDCIKREKRTINFLGLPAIFQWYSGGIGLPEKDKLENSWISCFYNKKQALQGYRILHELIVQYEFDWPHGTPGWVHQTFAVLEQMWIKLQQNPQVSN